MSIKKDFSVKPKGGARGAVIGRIDRSGLP